MVGSGMTITEDDEPSDSLRSLEKTLASMLVFLLPIPLPLPLPLPPSALVLVTLPVAEGRPEDVGTPHLRRGIGTCATEVIMPTSVGMGG